MIISLFIYQLTFIYNTYISYLIQGQTVTVIWSGNFLVLYKDLGRQALEKDYLFCFGLFCFELVLQLCI